MRFNPHPTALLGALLLAATTVACGSTGLGDILGGGGGGAPTGSASGQLQGTVQSVDTRDQVVLVRAESLYRSDLRNEGEQVALYYDANTRVLFEGREFRPEDLEPGDRIVAEVDESGNRFYVRNIEVTYDVTSGTGSRYPDDRYPDDRYGAVRSLQGTVLQVDTRSRLLELERTSWTRGFAPGSNSGDRVTVYYESGTRVEYQGRSYEPSSLERGDVVELDVVQEGNRLVARDIAVVRDARAGYR